MRVDKAGAAGRPVTRSVTLRVSLVRIWLMHRRWMPWRIALRLAPRVPRPPVDLSDVTDEEWAQFERATQGRSID